MAKKFREKPKKKSTIPYTYRITHIPSGQWYYGVRYAKGCHPNDLWISYYTSSAQISKLIEQDGKDAFRVEVRKLFHTKKSAIKWETKVNRRILHWPLVLNKCSWPAMTDESHRKTHLTKSKVGPDGLTGYQRSGKKWKEKQDTIDPETGLTYREKRRRKHNESLDKNGTRACSEEFKVWFAENNPSRRPDFKEKLNKTIKERMALGTYIPHMRGKKCPKVSERLRGNQIVVGMVWYNNGVKDFRLKPEDPRTEGLSLGRIVINNKGFVYEDKQCPHCSTIGGGGNMTRFHFDNCKIKPK